MAVPPKMASPKGTVKAPSKETVKASPKLPVPCKVASLRAAPKTKTSPKSAISQATSKRTKCAVNRGTYEAFGEDAEGEGAPCDQQPQTEDGGGGGPYVVLGKTEKGAGPSEKSDSEEDEEDEEEIRRQEKRRRAQEEEAKTTRQLRMIVIGCSILIFLILLAAVIWAGVFLGLLNRDEDHRHPTSGKTIIGSEANKRITYGYGECVAAFKKEPRGDIRSRCITTMSLTAQENEKCGLMCTRHLFRLFDDTSSSSDPKMLSPKVLPHQKKPLISNMDDYVFCQGWDQNDDRPSDDPLSLCVSGLCNGQYNGSKKGGVYSHDESSVASRGSWEDGCDHLHQCWDDAGDEVIFENPVFHREFCTVNAVCPHDGSISAVVYLQQMECVMNPDGLGPFCKSEPSPPAPAHSTPMFRLYRCKDCGGKPTPEALKQQHQLACTKNGQSYVSTEATKCSVLCKDSTTGAVKRVLLPDGAFCGQGNVFNYCVHGGCFWWNDSLKLSQIKGLKACENDAYERRERKALFGDTNWG